MIKAGINNNIYNEDFYRGKRVPLYNLHDIKKYYSDEELLNIIDLNFIKQYVHRKERKKKIEKLKAKI